MYYTELVERSLSNRGNIIPVKDLKIFKRDYEAYISMFFYDDSIIKHIENKNSIADYSGPVIAKNIWIDFDSEDRSESLKDSAEFITRMNEYFKVPYEAHRIYFSGAKGFHIGLPSELMGIENYKSDDLHLKVKKFVGRISGGLKTVDMKVYNTTRLWRIPYSLNIKSGGYKILLKYKTILEKDIDYIWNLSEMCARINNTDIHKPEFNHELKELFFKNGIKEEHKIETVGSLTLFRIPENGERNDILFKQAFRLFSVEGLKTTEALDIMRRFFEITNATSGGGVSEAEFKNIINSAFKRANQLKEEKIIRIHTLDKFTRQVYDTVIKSDFVPTGLNGVDEDLNGGLKLGDLYPVIGKSGTKKSLLFQWISTNNAINNNVAVLYFSLEMSVREFFRRQFQIMFGRDINQEIKDGKISENDISSIESEMKEKLKDNFFYVDNTELGTKDFDDIIKDTERKSGKKIKLVIVDSMNSMQSVGNNEVFTAFENTKHLKSIAKSTNTAVILICHVTKDCPQHLRDTSLYARGGQKIVDNGDAHFCLSSIVDKEKSILIGEDRDIKYVPDKVFIRFFNKRESGNVIDNVMNLNDSLNFESDIGDPRRYELNYVG